MIQNYRYFITLAEELNISRAAARLYISHQCLSKYLKDLETQCGVSLFYRKPKLSLTPAGELFYESLRQIELIEGNLTNQIANYHDSESGTLRFGTTEARFRILVPELLVRFGKRYPNVQLITECANSNDLLTMVIENRLDMMLTASPAESSTRLASSPIMDEQLYLVISDNLLRQYFSENLPEIKEEFRGGIHLRDFQHVPFVLNRKGYASRDMLDAYTKNNNISLNCVREIVQADLHYMLSARDYAASFCLTMFLPGAKAASVSAESGSMLNLFPIADFDTTNPVRLLYLKNKLFPTYGYDMITMLRDICRPYVDVSLE